MTDYYPFGEIRVDQSFTIATAANGATSSTPTATGYKNPYKFTGKELDTDIGLYYYGARYYNPAIGRFVSMDPWEGDIKDPQSLNKYSYVMNNPLKYVDPTGKTGEAFEEAWKKAKEKSNLSSFDNESSRDSTGNSIDYSNFVSGPIDEFGNPKQYDFSGITDVDDIMGAGITAGLSPQIRTLGEILGLIKKNIPTLNKNQNTEKPIVIGETMRRVKEIAEKNGWDYYKSRPANPSNYMKNNKSWIQRKIDEGREFLDIGRDSDKVSKNKPIGEYYQMEKNQIKKNEYPIKKIKIK